MNCEQIGKTYAKISQDTPRDWYLVPGYHNDIEKRLWGAADELRANSKLKAAGHYDKIKLSCALILA